MSSERLIGCQLSWGGVDLMFSFSFCSFSHSDGNVFWLYFRSERKASLVSFGHIARSHNSYPSRSIDVCLEWFHQFSLVEKI